VLVCVCECMWDVDTVIVPHIEGHKDHPEACSGVHILQHAVAVPCHHCHPMPTTHANPTQCVR
jgi:hypothetical protein